MFDFYKAADNSSVQLYLPKGAAIPAKIAARNWVYEFDVRDPGKRQAEQIAKQGYFMCEVSSDNASWTEL